MVRERKLDELSTHILQWIAEGRSYQQIVDGIGCTYLEIFAAAGEALRAFDDSEHPAYSVEKIRTKHPRAYLAWSEQEDSQLKQLAAAGKSTNEIATILQRQSSAIRSRLARFADEIAPKNGEFLAQHRPPEIE